MIVRVVPKGSAFRTPQETPPSAETSLDPATITWMQTLFNAWETTCRRHLRTSLDPLPWSIFYDQRHAWHLNPDKARLPVPVPVPTSLTFAGKRQPPLLRVTHDKKVWVPDRDGVPVKPLAVTMPYANEQKAVFLVPLPIFFHTLAGVDQAKALDELFLGLGIHELTHTRQLSDAARQIKRLRTKYRLPDSLDDNMVQTAFENNAEYKQLYDKEKSHLSRAILASTAEERQREIRLVLDLIQQRQERFFVGDKKGWAELDSIFLAVEGVAMWAQFQNARDRAPKGEDWLKTLTELVARHDSWSQSEGLALFLLIDRLAPGWQARFLAADFPSPITFLRTALRNAG
jgi:hypothetical protein